MGEIRNFLMFAESLKLVRKAEIENEKYENIIDEIYTDILPQDGILSKVNLPRTTVLVGRKGTGKSTIFQKSISDITKNKKVITVYIDVKTLYDNSTPTFTISDDDLISSEEVIKYLIYKSFIKQIIDETKRQLREKLNKSFIKTYLGFSEEKYIEITDSLKTMENDIDSVFKKIDISLITSIKNSIEKNQGTKGSGKLEISKSPKVEVDLVKEANKSIKQEFSNTFITYLDIKKSLIENLTKIKEILELKYLYIYLDDYSEIEEEAQKLFMEWFIAPLNNLSDDFVKFKIATYPKRFYYGKLDNAKIDEVPLDFFDAFYTYKNISKMEELALDYTKRLINNRAKVFFKNDNLFNYFDMKEEELYEMLFEVSMNIPRKMGYILSYCYESSLIQGNKITRASLGNASVRYYDEVIKRYFESNPYVIRPFNDKVTIENQKELMNKIIEKQSSNKRSIAKSNANLFKVEGKPTSHFVVSNELSTLLDSLELNGYISTYNKINDKNNVPSTLFSIDYGLCRKNNLNYGRPKDTEFRKYYNDTRFNFNNLIRNHFNETQILQCENMHEYPFELYDDIKQYSNMYCPKCLQDQIFSKCKIIVSNKELIDRIKVLEEKTLQLNDENEYSILDCLNQKHPESLSCTEIANLVDCSWQFVNKRADKLIENGLIETDDDNVLSKRRRYFKITRKARELIFKETNQLTVETAASKD